MLIVFWGGGVVREGVFGHSFQGYLQNTVSVCRFNSILCTWQALFASACVVDVSLYFVKAASTYSMRQQFSSHTTSSNKAVFDSYKRLMRITCSHQRHVHLR